MLDLINKLKEFENEYHKLSELGSNGKVLLVDGFNTYLRAFAAVPTMNDDGEHMGGLTGFLKSVGMISRNLRPTRIVCIFDGAGGSQRRRALYEDYKSNRRTMQRLNRTYDFKSLEEEKESIRWQMHLLVEILGYLPVTVLAIENIEADDTIAYLSHIIANRGGKSIILSTDKDFLQIVGNECSVYNPIKKKMYDVETVTSEYGIHPNNFLLYRVVEGDKSDNISGVKGVGSVTLKKLFPALSQERQLTFSDLLSPCKENKKLSKSSACRKLLEAQEKGQLELNYQLMTLADDNIAGATKIKILDIFDHHVPTINKLSLTKRLSEHKLLSSFGNYDEWLLSSWSPLSRFHTESA